MRWKTVRTYGKILATPLVSKMASLLYSILPILSPREWMRVVITRVLTRQSADKIFFPLSLFSLMVIRTYKCHKNQEISYFMIASESLSKQPYHDISENTFLCG